MGDVLTGSSGLQHQLWMLRHRGFDARVTEEHDPIRKRWSYRLVPPGVYRDRIVAWARRVDDRRIMHTINGEHVVVEGDSPSDTAGRLALVLAVLEHPGHEPGTRHPAEEALDRIAAIVTADASFRWEKLDAIEQLLRESGREV